MKWEDGWVGEEYGFGGGGGGDEYEFMGNEGSKLVGGDGRCGCDAEPAGVNDEGGAAGLGGEKDE